MATVGDVYLVRLNMTSLGQKMNNVFTYRAGSVECSSPLMVDNFNLNVTILIQNIVSEFTFLDSLYIENLNDPVDFITDSYAAGTKGGALGEVMPLANAGAFRSPTKHKAIRAGSKRFGLLSAADVQGNVWGSGTAVQSALASLAAGLSEDITGGGSAIWSPIIIKRDFVPATPDHKAYYVIPPSTVGKMYYVADNWEAIQTISTQNSRKIGN